VLTFSVPQKEFQVGNVTIGGPPGRNPPVLSGSIFFTGHLVVKDPQKGIFDHDRVRRKGSPSFEAAAATLLAHPLISGADFLFYGPMRNSTWVYSACAAVAAMTAYGETLEGIRPIEEHPLYRIF
jgi:tetrahydromethanopterin S-methyltransferase subunit H